MPWAKRVTSRSDDVYLATSTDNLDGLLKREHQGKMVPTITAYEIRELIIGELKPLNVSNQKWIEIENFIKQMDDNKLFIEY